MNIKVGKEVHYVPDILFKDGTFKDADDYIITMLKYNKVVSQMLPVEEKVKKTPTTRKKIVANIKSKFYTN